MKLKIFYLQLVLLAIALILLVAGDLTEGAIRSGLKISGLVVLLAALTFLCCTFGFIPYFVKQKYITPKSSKKTNLRE